MADPAMLVGGMQSRLSVLKTALQEAGWKVHVFLNPKDALEQLKAGSYAAVFCDEEMRGASVAGLMVWAWRLKANIPIYVFGDVADTARFKVSGMPTAILSYPPVKAHLPIPKGNPTMEERLALEKTSLAGHTSMVALGHMLEMMGISGQAALIELDFGKSGSVHLNQGVIEHATSFAGYAQTQGLKALGQLLRLEHASFRVLPYEATKRNSINLPVATALTEAARLADEERRYQKMIDDIVRLCPAVTAIAIGYPLATAPIQGFGNATDLFQRAKDLLSRSREALGDKAIELLISSEQVSLALVSLNEGNIMVASGPLKARGALFKALKEASQAVLA
jgi:hypothetical protein